MCTGIYIGKKVSANGRTLVGRSADSSKRMDNISTVRVNKRKYNQKGKYLKASDSKLKFPLPNTCYKYFSLPNIPNEDRGSISKLSANEYGLFTTSSVSALVDPKIVKYDPFCEGGLCEEVLPDIIGMSCKTPRQAIDLLGNLMEKYGAKSAENCMIANKDEAWIIEFYTGHQWAAYKLPEDKVCAYGNAFNLTTEYVNAKDGDFLHSKDVFEIPKKSKRAIMRNGHISLAESYEGPGNYIFYVSIRAYFARKLLSPSTTPKNFKPNKRLDFLYKPDKKVKLKDVFELFRCRYEGSKFCPETNGRNDIRLIGTESQYNVHVAEIYDDLPDEMAVSIWSTMGDSEHSIFLPYSNFLTKITKSFSYHDTNSNIWDTKKFETDSNDRPILYNDKLAYINFKKLSFLAKEDRKLYGRAVRDYWSKKETMLIKEYDKILKQTFVLFQKDKKSARDYLNNYSINLDIETEAEAKSLFDELIWYIMSNIETLKYPLNRDKLRMEYKETPAFKPTFCYKDKYLNK